MLHGRRLDRALEHVDGSRYALVHAVAKRARQITLWLTADPAELRAEAAPPPLAGETISRDPVALSEAEILDGEVIVHWDPDGRVDEREIPDTTTLETDPLLIEGLDGEDDDDTDLDDEAESLTPALAQAMEPATAQAADADAAADDVEDLDDIDEDEEALEEGEDVLVDEAVDEAIAEDVEEMDEISLEEVDEGDDGESEEGGSED